MATNFVSVSAVVDRVELARVADLYKQYGFKFPLVIGYQVSNNSINRGTRGPRQPNIRELGDLANITGKYGLVPAIHYYSKDIGTIPKDLERMVDLGIEPSLLQFNTLPPSVDILKKAKDMGFKIIFKVAVSDKYSSRGGYAPWKNEDGVQDVSSGRVEPLLNQVYDVRDLVEYAMFDPSHGTNLKLDFGKNALAVRFGKGIITNKELNRLGLVYAGGINPNNIGPLIELANRFFPNRVSIDLESGIRTNDRLDIGLVGDCLLKCDLYGFGERRR